MLTITPSLLQGSKAGMEKIWTTSQIINNQFSSKYIAASVQVGSGWAEMAPSE